LHAAYVVGPAEDGEADGVGVVDGGVGVAELTGWMEWCEAGRIGEDV
jgi:hypothetical protein